VIFTFQNVFELRKGTAHYYLMQVV